MKTTKPNDIETYPLYGGKVVLEYRPKRHIYSVGKKGVYGVTGVTALLPQEWMANYQKKYIGEKFRDLLGGMRVEKIDDVSSFINNVWLRFEEAKSAPEENSRAAAQLGTNVHGFVGGYLTHMMMPQIGGRGGVNKITANYIRSLAEYVYEFDPDDDVVELLRGLEREGAVKIINTRTPKGVENCLSDFRQFLATHEVEPILIERKIFSQKNKFAGTADLVAEVDGKMTLVDWKTSKSLYPSYFVQASAYAEAINEELKVDKSLLPRPIEQVMIVNLNKESRLDVQVKDKWAKEFKVFLALLEVKDYLSKSKVKN